MELVVCSFESLPLPDVWHYNMRWFESTGEMSSVEREAMPQPQSELVWVRKITKNAGNVHHFLFHLELHQDIINHQQSILSLIQHRATTKVSNMVYCVFRLVHDRLDLHRLTRSPVHLYAHRFSVVFGTYADHDRLSLARNQYLQSDYAFDVSIIRSNELKDNDERVVYVIVT